MKSFNACYLIAIICTSLSAHADENHKEAFRKTTDCAALMAVVSQKNNGELSAQQAAFEKIGYTLGKAENHRQDGKLQESTEATYQKKVLVLFQSWPKLQGEQKQAKQQHFQQCLKDAELYDPKTQIPALIEKAKQQQL